MLNGVSDSYCLRRLRTYTQEIKLIMQSDSTVERTSNSITMTTITTVEGYQAIPTVRPLASETTTPESGETAVHIADGDHHTIEDVVVLEGLSCNSSSHVSATLKRYMWRTLLALISIITAITVLVGQTILGASLTNTDNMIGNVKAEVQSIMLATNGGGGVNRNNSSAT